MGVFEFERAWWGRTDERRQRRHSERGGKLRQVPQLKRPCIQTTTASTGHVGQRLSSRLGSGYQSWLPLHTASAELSTRICCRRARASEQPAFLAKPNWLGCQVTMLAFRGLTPAPFSAQRPAPSFRLLLPPFFTPRRLKPAAS